MGLFSRRALWPFIGVLLVCGSAARSWALPYPGDAPLTDPGVVENSGALIQSIDIPLPPATGGFQPGLTLRYSSQSGDGPFGVGWALRAGEIRRASRYGVPIFDDSVDAFELDDQLLVRNPAESTSTRTRFHEEVEEYKRILHIVEGGQDYWEVTGPDGTRLRYGIDAASRVLRGGTSGPIARWLLSEIVSTDGNVVIFDHLIENGADYPQKVRFSYRGTPRTAVGALRTVEFRYETRPDPSFDFTGGIGRNMTKRVTDILVTVGTSTFRRLDLIYSGETGAGKTYGTGRSRLAQLKMFGVGGTAALPAQKFEYRDAADLIGTGTNWQATAFGLPTGMQFVGANGEDRGTRFGDVDGDGRMDVVRAYQDASGALSRQVFLNRGTTWEQSASWEAALALDTQELETTGRKLQYTVQQSGSTFTLVSATTSPHPNQVRFASAAEPAFSQPTGSPLVQEYRPPTTWILEDVTGDGRADLVSSYDLPEPGSSCSNTPTGKWLVGGVWKNTGSAWEYDAALTVDLPGFRRVILECTASGSAQALVRLSEPPRVADLNGDQKPDFIFPDSGRVFLQGATPGSPWQESPALQLAFSPLSAVVDINRDGLADVLVGNGSNRDVFLNTGSGWCSSAQTTTACGAFAARYKLPAPFATNGDLSSLALADLNGDGLLDVLRMDRSLAPSTGLAAWLHDPRPTSSSSVWVSSTSFRPPKAAALIDLNFDGAPGLVDLAPGAGDYTGMARFADLLTRNDTGMGGTITFTYESGVKQRADDLEELADDTVSRGDGAVRWTTEPVLATRAFAGVDVQPYAQEFFYARPEIDLQRHARLGFAVVNSRGPRIADSYVYYGQELGLTGKVFVREVGDYFYNTGQRSFFYYDVLRGDDPAAGPGSTSAATVARMNTADVRQIYHPFSAQQKDGASQATYYEYGAQSGSPGYGYGFATKISEYRSTGARITTRKPAPPDTASWIVQRPEEVLVSDGAGSQIARRQLQYDTAGHVTSISDFEGPRGDLSAATARTTLRTYDAFGNLRSETDPANHVNRFCYDGDTTFSNNTSCSSPATSATHSATVSVLDALGEVTTQTPDPVTGLVGEVRHLYSGHRDKTTYDPFGRLLITSFLPSGQTTDTVLSENRYFDLTSAAPNQAYVEQLVRTTSGSTAVVRSATYLDGFGSSARQVEEAPLAGTAKRYLGSARQYDPVNGNLKEMFAAACASGGADAHCMGLANGSQPFTKTFFDDLGHTFAINSPDGNDEYDYRSVTRTHPDFGVGQFDLVLHMDPRGNLEQRIYDGDRLVWVEECTNTVPADTLDITGVNCANPKVTFYRYEPGGQIAEIYDAMATDPHDPAQAKRRLVFDSLGRVVQSRELNKTGSDTTVFDATGAVAQTTNARGQQASFLYDALGRLTQVTYPSALGTRAYALTYDPVTRKAKTVTQTQTAPTTSTLSVEQYTYDSIGRPTRATMKIRNRATLVMEQDFDLLGRQTRIRTPDKGTVLAYEYEGNYMKRVCELGSATSCAGTVAAKYISNVEYNALGQPTGIVGPTPSGAAAPRMNMVYSATNYRLSKLETIPSAGTGAERVNLTYNYDEAGLVRSVLDGSINSGANDVSHGVSFTYDERNRIATRTRGSDTKFFTYDASGNLLGKGVSTAGATNQQYDPLRRNQIVQSQGVTYAYDADGNMTQRGSQRFLWDALGRMECAGTATSSCPEPYLYGLDGQRIASDGGTASPRIFMGEGFEWEPTLGSGSGAATMRVFAMGRQIAYKRMPSFTLRTESGPPGMPLSPFALQMLRWLPVLGFGAALLALLWAGQATGLRTRPAFASAAIAAIVLLLVPPALAPASLPTNLGVYRRWVWEDQGHNGVHITDDRGVIMHERGWEPFGQVAAEKSSEATERRYGMHQFEETTGLYYMNARYYDPAIGRFLGIDPVIRDVAAPQSLNAYSYVENNPPNLVDPSGMAPPINPETPERGRTCDPLFELCLPPFDGGEIVITGKKGGGLTPPTGPPSPPALPPRGRPAPTARGGGGEPAAFSARAIRTLERNSQTGLGDIGGEETTFFIKVGPNQEISFLGSTEFPGDFRLSVVVDVLDSAGRVLSTSSGVGKLAGSVLPIKTGAGTTTFRITANLTLAPSARTGGNTEFLPANVRGTLAIRTRDLPSARSQSGLRSFRASGSLLGSSSFSNFSTVSGGLGPISSLGSSGFSSVGSGSFGTISSFAF